MPTSKITINPGSLDPCGHLSWLAESLSRDSVLGRNWTILMPAHKILKNCPPFLAGNQLYELKCNRRGWCCCGCGPKKLIVIFTYRQRLLSINMKTKVVQHVKSERLKECESVRVREWESVRVRECDSERVTFQHRHENKSCSACQEWVKEWDERVRWECESVRVWEWLLSIEMKTKVVQHV